MLTLDPITTSDGIELQTYHWPAATPVRGALFLVHGLAEHAGRHDVAGKFFARAGWELFSYDQRGHGRTKSPRVDSPSIDQLTDDLRRFLEAVSHRASAPVAGGMGHSFGGLMLLSYLIRQQPKNGRYVITSPLLLPTRQPSHLTEIAGRMVARIRPTTRFSIGLKPEQLSRDSAEVSRYVEDKLCQRSVSVRLGIAMLAEGEWVLEHASELSHDVLMIHGDADQVTDCRASRQFAARAGERCELWIEPEGHHELHHDLCRAEHLKRMLAWFDT